MELRLLKALSLLRDPGVKIIHVAEQCGFNHLGLFNACFKKRFGKTPGQWRKGSANGQEPLLDSNVGNPLYPRHADGSCLAKPKPDDCIAMARKTASTQKASRSEGPANPQLREAILTNIREVSAQMTGRSSSGVKSQNPL
jgi:hypothetical protein